MIKLIYVSKSKIKGEGVFASRDIKKEEKICKMRGEKITAKDLYKTSQLGRDIVVDPLQISEDNYLNMIRPYVLINHSCEPNAGIKNENLVAIKKIKEGEEITYDYSSTWFDGFNCKCGSKVCRGHIGDFSGIPKNTQRKYLQLEIVPDFIKNNLKL